MKNDTSGPELSADALREWEGHLEDILRGVAHALNNRAASVSAVIELWADSTEEASSTRSLLVAEAQRLRDLVDVVRTVGAQHGAEEAFDPSDAVSAARAVIGLHAGLRERSITIASDTAPPVRTRKWLFVRALVGLAASSAAATARSGHAGSALSVTVSRDADDVAVRVSGDGLSPGLTPYVLEVSRAMGGTPLADAPGFRMPSLAELRRREGR
jgi:hypothetical protein